MKYALFIFAAVAAVTLTAHAITIYVPGDYPTIQAGIDAAVDGDTVLVAPDTYFELIDFSGKEVVVISSDGPEVTIIDGEQQGPIVTIDSGEGPGAVLEGFTIINGFHMGIGSAGIHCGEGTTPVIRCNIIQNNGGLWSGLGGGISVWGAGPLIEQNQIIANQCEYNGGGIFVLNGANVTVTGNLITANYVGSGYGVAFGGGMYIKDSRVTVDHNVICSNINDPPFGQGGGGIALEGTGYADVHNNTVVYNVSEMPGLNTGGGFYIGGLFTSSPDVDLQNNIVVSNQGGGIAYYPMGTSELIIDFNDFWGNIPFEYYGCTAGLFDISADPQFSVTTFELTENSPCIDAGSFTAGLDPDGTRTDMGAYYYDQVSVNVAIVPDDWPVVIPGTGGNFAYTLYLTNNTPSQAEFDVWVDARMPDGTIVGPLILRQDIVFSPDQQLQRSITQSVPGGALGGTYYYMAHTGDYNTSTVYHETVMPFVKEGSDDAGGDWSVSSQWGVTSSAPNTIQPGEEALDLEAVPNPFNPITTLCFTLRASGHTTLTVYDLAGRTLASLLDRNLEMGIHSVRFDGSHLTSGVYVAVLQQGAQLDSQRILLMK